MIEDVVVSGKGDLNSLCRPFVREPNLINRWLSGDTSPSQCDFCDSCLRVTERNEKLRWVVTTRAEGTPKKKA